VSQKTAIDILFQIYNFQPVSFVFNQTPKTMPLLNVTKQTLLCFLLLSATIGVAQKRVLLFIKNPHRQAIYKIGDDITFRLHGSSDKYTQQIIALTDSLIVFDGLKINPKAISALYVDKKTKDWYIVRYKYPTLLPIAGGMFLGADLFNTKRISKPTLIISGSLIGAGLLAQWLVKDYIKLKGQTRLAIITMP
jgi:hypothetical protein